MHSKSYVSFKINFDLSLFPLPKKILFILEKEILGFVNQRMENMVLIKEYSTFSVDGSLQCSDQIPLNLQKQSIISNERDLVIFILPQENKDYSFSFQAKSKTCLLDPRSR